MVDTYTEKQRREEKRGERERERRGWVGAVYKWIDLGGVDLDSKAADNVCMGPLWYLEQQYDTMSTVLKKTGVGIL